MKTIIILITALFTLQVSVLFAGNESTTVTGKPVEITLDIAALIPVIPAEAAFDDVNIDFVDFCSVAPVVPVEAEFEDVVPVIDLRSLAPVTPMVADFE